MRIAFIALHFAEYSAHLAAALAASNDVLLVMYGDNVRNELGDRLAKDFVRARLTVVMIEPAKGISSVFRNTLSICSAVRNFRPDVVHLQEGLRDELVLSLPVLRRYPLLMTIHDPVNHSGQDAKALRFSRYKVYRRIIRRSVDAVFAHGAALVDDVVQQIPRLKGKAYSVPHGPLGPIGPITLTKPDADQCSFLFFGRIHEYKGLRYFIEAIQQVRQQGHLVTGVIAGRGSDLQPNMSLIEKTPEAFLVIERFISEEQVRRLFLETTAAVLPYVDGTQSGVAALALGYGRPVIATRVGAIPELVRDGVNGILVGPRNTEELAAAMLVLARDKHVWMDLALAALELRSGELSWKVIAANTEKAYRTTITNADK